MVTPRAASDAPSDVTRRRLLHGVVALPALGLAATALAACGSDEPAPEAIEIEPSAAAEPDETLLDELALIGAYAGTIAVYDQLRGSLTAIADQHRAHARELGATEADLAAVEPIPPNAGNAKQALANLITRERNAAGQRSDAAASADDPERIRALTFIAASESSHVPELKDIRTGVNA